MVCRRGVMEGGLALVVAREYGDPLKSDEIRLGRGTAILGRRTAILGRETAILGRGTAILGWGIRRSLEIRWDHYVITM